LRGFVTNANKFREFVREKKRERERERETWQYLLKINYVKSDLVVWELN